MAGLLDALKQYISDAMPGGLLNRETAPVAEAAGRVGGLLSDPAGTGRNMLASMAAAAKAQQQGLADAWGDPERMADATLGMLSSPAGGFANLGMTAWHGSPYKFDKFDLSKIGTGEGAQAYGHGLYLAEHPKTALTYQQPLYPDLMYEEFNGGPIMKMIDRPNVAAVARRIINNFGGDAKEFIKYETERMRAFSKKIGVKEAESAIGGNIEDAKRFIDGKITRANNSLDLKDGAAGHLYKTDIPDEAVARMLDWDKPLSQQAEVIKAIENAGIPAISKNATGWRGAPEGMYESAMATRNGEWLYREMLDNNQLATSDKLRELGIPGIKYLDGGSRAAGQGSSNFVVFDPDMIRILERNGVPTGAEPWKPGEWGGLLGR